MFKYFFKVKEASFLQLGRRDVEVIMGIGAVVY